MSTLSIISYCTYLSISADQSTFFRWNVALPNRVMLSPSRSPEGRFLKLEFSDLKTNEMPSGPKVSKRFYKFPHSKQNKLLKASYFLIVGKMSQKFSNEKKRKEWTLLIICVPSNFFVLILDIYHLSEMYRLMRKIRLLRKKKRKNYILEHYKIL